MAEQKFVKTEFPLARVKAITKSTENTGNINREAIFVITKATEMFVQYLGKNLYKAANTGTIQYNHLAKHVSEDEKLEFLIQIIPQKFTVKKCKEIIAAKENESSSSEDDEETPKEELKKPKK